MTLQNKTPFEQVGEFHQAFAHPWYQKGRHAVIDSKAVKLRLRLIFEEVEELCEALFVKADPTIVVPQILDNVVTEEILEDKEIVLPADIYIQGFNSLFALIEEHIAQMTDEDLEVDIVEVADALADINYVVNGSAHTFNLQLDTLTTEVHRSNMSKLGEDGKPIYRANDHKVVKGPNYTPPNIQSVLDVT